MRCQKMLHAGAFTSGFTEASNSKVVPPETLHTDMSQPSSLWRRMLRYRSMSNNKKALIMNVDYRKKQCVGAVVHEVEVMVALLLACDAFVLLMSPASS